MAEEAVVALLLVTEAEVAEELLPQTELTSQHNNSEVFELKFEMKHFGDNKEWGQK